MLPKLTKTQQVLNSLVVNNFFGDRMNFEKLGMHWSVFFRAIAAFVVVVLATLFVTTLIGK